MAFESVRMITGRLLVAATLGGLASGLTGCAGPSELMERGFVLLESAPGATPLYADDMYPLQSADFRLTTTYGDGPLVHQRRPTERLRAQGSNAEGDQRTTFWRTDERGNLLMTAVIDHDEGAISVFEPALIVAYANLGPGEQREQEVKMRVVDERNPRRLREAGSATQTIHYVEDQRLRTPMGTFDTKRLELHFKADLRLADAEKRRTLFVATDHGAVVEQVWEQIVILGVVPSVAEATLVLQGIEPVEPRREEQEEEK
jgi:hypothetical protein